MTSALDDRVLAAMAEARARIAELPRVRFALLPTPMEEARQLTRRLGGPRIFVKRDDLTGIAFGGNKTRNLEYRLARTIAEGADTVIVGLDLQSNSARQTIGACNKLGLKVHLVLEGARPNVVQGNLLVDYLLGASVHFAADAAEQRTILDRLAGEVRAAGGKPHILNDNPMFDIASAVAYIESTFECLEQLSANGVSPTAFYMSSSGKGAAGLMLAQKITGLPFRVHCVSATSEYDLPKRTASIANSTAGHLGLDVRVTPNEVVNFANFVGVRYGVPSTAGNDAVKLFAETEGLILDPVYTGKAAAAMLAHIRDGMFGADDALVFVHTGGSPAIFTHSQYWT
jgi:1-aminocyclopropane-1-carboxylate deaminase/D-cysteine desulfhydrase-like pyridoxal-dependent ACC family enzyme